MQSWISGVILIGKLDIVDENLHRLKLPVCVCVCVCVCVYVCVCACACMCNSFLLVEVCIFAYLCLRCMMGKDGE